MMNGTGVYHAVKAFVAVLVLALCGSTLAGGPETIAIHGAVMTGAGEPVTGNHACRLQFWNAAIDGAQIGSDIDGTTTLSSEGRFNIAVTPPQDALTATDVWYALYLDTDDNGIDPDDLFGDRVKIHAVPFARTAQDADTLGGAAASDFATDAELAAGLATRADIVHEHDASEITLGELPDAHVADDLTVSSSGSVDAESIQSGTVADARLSSNVTLQGNTFNGADQLVQLDGSGRLPAVDGSQLTGIGDGIPSGAIILWSGSAGSIPSDWLLCDGASGTPDLRDRFVVGAGNAYAVGETGGSTSHNHGGSTGATGRQDAGIPQSPWGKAPPNHTHSISSDEHLPPYYALCYIMKQ